MGRELYAHLAVHGFSGKMVHARPLPELLKKPQGEPMPKKGKKKPKRLRPQTQQDWFPKGYLYDPKTGRVRLPPGELRRLRTAYARVGLDLRQPRLTFTQVVSAYFEIIPEDHLMTILERARLAGIIPDEDFVKAEDEEAQRKQDVTRLLIKAKIICRTNRAMTRWFETPCTALGGCTPKEMCKAEGGIEAVERLLDDMQCRKAKNPEQPWSREEFDRW
jgi:hypothetical protein